MMHGDNIDWQYLYTLGIAMNFLERFIHTIFSGIILGGRYDGSSGVVTVNCRWLYPQ